MEQIPRYPLKHKEEIVSFAIRTLEQAYEESKGRSDNPHRHDFYTLLWIKSGQGVHTIDFVDYPIEKHHLHIIRPGQVHQFRPSQKPTGVAVLFTEEFLDLHAVSKGFFTNLYLFDDCDQNQPLPIKKAEDLSFMDNLSYIMFKELEQADTLSYDVIAAHLKLLLIRCQRNLGRIDRKQEEVRSLVKEFKDLVEIEFRQFHKVLNYAERLHITSNHLNEVIKSSMGLTAKEYVQNRIILEAKREAYFTDHTGKEVAYYLGFEDPAHFSKFFKNCTGISFSKFRSSIR